MKKENLVRFILSIAVALLTGALSSLVAGDTYSMYQAMQKPPLSPPSIVFPIVWTILYILMGFSYAWLLTYGEGSEEELRRAKLLYGAQLFVNFLWSIVYFRFESIGGGLFVILVLLVLVLFMIIQFYQISKPAALLNLPYLLWLLFAIYLNVATYILN